MSCKRHGKSSLEKAYLNCSGSMCIIDLTATLFGLVFPSCYKASIMLPLGKRIKTDGTFSIQLLDFLL
jgi:hypothetical protein